MNEENLPAPAPTPGPASPPPDAPPPPAPPPAAAVVVAGAQSERENQLLADLDKERAARKQSEIEASYARDELHRLKTAPPAPPPAAEKNWLEKWMHGDA